MSMNGAGTSESIQKRLCRFSSATVEALGGDEAVSAILGSKGASLVNRCYKLHEKHRFTSADVVKLNAYQVSVGELPEFLALEARSLGYELRQIHFKKSDEDPVDTVLKAAQEATALTMTCINAASDHKITADELEKIIAAGDALREAQRAIDALQMQASENKLSVVGSAA
ncbi:hypothetical protein [Pseudovibrio sp. POLY-S9]|uniref:hypothetical protein n=1 Tax=Pseudovibrio sp. POLY-S9 TaxID=1576596 RepID=UPI00070B0F2D|nr:hypothetical protein [Pseudovibrio sp. POLY-S9]